MFWISILGLAMAFSACEDSKNTIQRVPLLKIISTSVLPAPAGYDSLVYVDFLFEDGDGDIGLSEADTFGGFAFGRYDFHNVKVYMQFLSAGRWEYALNPLTGNRDTIDFHERLPRLVNSEKQKAVSGEMRLNIPAKPYGFRADSLRFIIRISDRALNRSPWDTSQTVFLKH